MNKKVLVVFLFLSISLSAMDINKDNDDKDPKGCFDLIGYLFGVINNQAQAPFQPPLQQNDKEKQD